MGMIDMEFDKYCIVDANCSSFIDKKGTVKKIKQDFSRDINFHRFRSSSCKSSPTRDSRLEDLAMNSPKSRRKIEIANRGAKPFTFFEILDSCCNSEEEDDDEDDDLKMKRNDIVLSSDGFLEISFDSPDGRKFESAEQCRSGETDDQKLLLRFDSPGNCLSETENNSNTSTPNSTLGRFKENKFFLRKKKKSTLCRSLLNEFSNTSIKESESERKLFSPAHLRGFLKVENRNGLLPSFEFSMNFPEDVLVAQTLKTDDITKWAYTFSSFRNRRKCRKGSGSSSSSSMLAQMQVSSSSSSITECVLYDNATKVGKCDGLMNLNPKVEIAAIEIESWRDEKCISRMGRVNVITGAGKHGLPPSGDSIGPSSLLERWRSGGGCDCGGWDMACSLTVLANHMCADNQHCFQLFLQGMKDDKTPALSMMVLGEGQYSIEFHARLSTLQAFSICIAILHSTLLQHQEHNEKPLLNRDQMKVFAEEEVNRLTAAQDERRTEINKQVFVNPSFLVNPPFSPIARV
ncbi:uncharacterized protein LOC124941075 [Impatiens glandulifera]|uniref:uncharacterized protein LOC124941075 n=1 Tax=Impatiens glandulifera TaxID=253017 RepID=UPI001FB097AB|nr:uncharacterized protein LOC124941075 [Impatiens glandulifera]XP_047337291.1 uncharacterized protein LOC124941075 [Impatiens glandulifera]XP_047337293.1 uncharacterized protein LOC124941075 [Impatiens glandulifera]XP_047337294.1 uncharacterized protein LOC124941075 [Impatiens glandulifera]XP_047337295.1 uncharacterized protein LOC124941075 [Impatiens glandulifera]XP_047337296.1 uncharacterized protein LOC124941075 [Impatiens glandulifera]